MIKKLVKLANHLDSRGFSKEADYLDDIIKLSSTKDDFEEDIENEEDEMDRDIIEKIKTLFDQVYTEEGGASAKEVVINLVDSIEKHIITQLAYPDREVDRQIRTDLKGFGNYAALCDIFEEDGGLSVEAIRMKMDNNYSGFSTVLSPMHLMKNNNLKLSKKVAVKVAAFMRIMMNMDEDIMSYKNHLDVL